MIDPKSESLIKVINAANHFPSIQGKKPHKSTVYRWVYKGTRGVRLESIFIGGVRCTTLEAISRFIENATDTQNRKGQLPYRSPKQRNKASEDASKELEKLGI